MDFPKNYKYSKTHEWVEFEDVSTAKIGITDYAQQELGALVFVNFPEVGDKVIAGEYFADVESVKTVSDILSPVTGIIEEINDDLLDDPSLINKNANDSWFLKVKNITAKTELLSSEQYVSLIEKSE